MPYTRAGKKKFLDLFYEYFEDEYKYCHSNGISTNELFQVLKETYPTEFAEVMIAYDQKFVG